jgi:hypothetical protein
MEPAEILRFREHVDSCADCRSKIAPSEVSATVLRAWIDPEPDEQELVMFAAGKLTGERAGEIEAHLTECEECRAAVQDLRTFAKPKAVVEMPARRRSVPLWWGVVAATVLVGVYAISRPGKPEVVASLHDGPNTVAVSRSGDVSGVNGASDEERVLIAEALRTGRMPLPTLSTPTAGVLRGDASNQPFRLFEPMNRRTLTDRPEFRWGAMDGASSYQVTVFTEDEKIVDQGMVTETRWEPTGVLPRGGRLYWQVTAIRDGQRATAPAPPAPRAWFEIVSAETARKLAAMQQAGGSNLRLAVAYAHQGLQVEAGAIMRNVLADNPDSDLARRLRDSLLIK